MHEVALFGEMLADVFPDKTILGGAPYNVARHLHGFLQHPVLITRLGGDPLKNQFLTELSRLNMDTAGLQFDSVYPTGQVTVYIENGMHRFEISPHQAYDYIDANEVIYSALSVKPKLVYFGSLAQRNKESCVALGSLLEKTDCLRFLDINLRKPWYNKSIIQHSLSNANFVKVSEEELTIIGDMFELSAYDSKIQASFLIEKFELTTLFVTCGKYGAWALSNTGKEFKTERQDLSSQLIDTVGAGDAFSAISILGILNHWPIELTINRANTFAAEICKISGATPATNDFYLPFLLWLDD
ncbi:MAG: carbohydrate kinase family protein [Methylophilaceae bacterium]